MEIWRPVFHPQGGPTDKGSDMVAAHLQPQCWRGEDRWIPVIN